MYPYSIDELAWAAARAIKEEVRQTRSGSVEKEDASKSAHDAGCLRRAPLRAELAALTPA